MSWTQAVRVVSCLAVLIACGGCGENRLLGRSCGPEDCALQMPPTATGCHARFDIPETEVVGGGELERCVPFSLEMLNGAPSDASAVYIEHITITQSPVQHDVYLRTADRRMLEGLPMVDGSYDCRMLERQMVQWVPLMTTAFGSGATMTGAIAEQSFADAPLKASRMDILLVKESYANVTEDSVALGVTVDLTCSATKPPKISHSFVFTAPETPEIPAGRTEAVDSFCAFEEDVMIARLYRRTRGITRFDVDSEAATDLLPWTSVEIEVFKDFPEPDRLVLRANERLSWKCTYNNDNVNLLPITVGGSDADKCELLGLYQRPDEDETDADVGAYCRIN